MTLVGQDRIFYEESAGGVTFSGGEPLMQPQFLRALLEACRAHGLHAAVDTCGFGCTDHLLAVAPLTDLFLYDLKFMDDEPHRQYCGVSNRPILENLQALGRIHDRVWVRVPLIPGLNDTDENLTPSPDLLLRFTGPPSQSPPLSQDWAGQVAGAWARPPALEGVEKPSAERMEKAVEIFSGFGLATRTGG